MTLTILTTGFICVNAADSTSKTLRLLDCTTASTQFSDCNPTNYAIRVGIFTAPGVLMFLLLWLCCPFYCCGKYCCNCCGGRRQTPNCCCPDMRYPARYSKGDLMRPKVLGFLALLLAGGGVAWGVTGVVDLIAGLSDLRDVFVAIPDVLQAQIDQIESALIISTYDPMRGLTTTNLFEASSIKNVSQDVRTTLKSNINSAADSFRTYIDYFAKAVAAMFAIPLALILIGQLPAVCACRTCIPMTIVWFLFLFGGLLWLGHGIFSALSMVVGDVCAEIKGLANQQTNVLPIVLQCKDSIFDSFRSSFKRLATQQATETCKLMISLCYDSSKPVADNIAQGTIFSCPSSVDCTTTTFAALYSLIKTSFAISPLIAQIPGAKTGGYYCHTATTCSIFTCTTQCLLGGAGGTQRGPSGNSSLQIYTSFQAANQVTNAVDTVGAQFSNCDSVIGIIMNPAARPCTPITKGLQFARQSSGLEGLAVLMALFVFAWGSKRFIPLDQAEKPQMDGRELQDLDDDGLK